jgi:hypothetical protein
MRVIGAGLPRTGTSSLETALDRLGCGPCYHTRTILDSPAAIDSWLAAYRGEPVDLAGLLAGYEATTDSPACFFWRELVAAFPAARVVLTVRDPESWRASMSATVLRRELIDADNPVLAGVARLQEALVRYGLRGRTDHDGLLELFDRHTAEVVAAVPAERLLVYRIEDGWEPLCAFLDVAVPAEPFPRLNDTAEFVGRLAEHRGRR